MAKKIKCEFCGEKMTYDGENYYCKNCWAIGWVDEDGEIYFNEGDLASENVNYIHEDDIRFCDECGDQMVAQGDGWYCSKCLDFIPYDDEYDE